jgi:hypothetical protein
VARFRVGRRGVVRVAVSQTAPRCRFVGRYTVAVERGAQVLRLRRRFGKHRLGPGSYRYVGSAFGREVLDVAIRFVRKGRSLAVRRDRVADACATTSSAAAFTSVGTVLAGAIPAVAGTGGQGGSGAAGRGASSSSAGGTNSSPGTKSASAPRTGDAPFRPPVQARTPSVGSASRLLLLLLLAAAVGVLALASLPERAPVGGAIARHRGVVSAGGLALLVVAAIILFT